MPKRISKTITLNRLHKFLFVSLFYLTLLVGNSNAQPLPTGSLSESHYRLLELISDSSKQSSFTNRPVWKQSYLKVIANLPSKKSSIWYNQIGNRNLFIYKDISVGLYDPILAGTFNSQLPYSENNGAAWYGKGINSEIKAGGWITSNYFTIALNPVLSYQQNQNFNTPRFIPNDSNGNPRYRSIINNIDMPFRFGYDSYSTLDLGNSSIRFHYKAVEIGVAKENLWWGPGQQYALLMSNNAPGLKHLFLGTRYPINLPLNSGSFEFKLIGAWPEDSNYFDLREQFQRDRFLSAANIIFSPSVLPNLHLGFGRVIHRYTPESGLDLGDFLNALKFGNRQTSGNDNQNQLVSFYFRWVFPKSDAEIYGEYFREDSFFDLRDLFLEPDHDRAYTVGAQKILESEWINFYKINIEFNNLVPNRVDEVRPQVAYYTHAQIRQGHTNGGQVLGAAIGPGSGSQYLGVEGYFDRGMLGMFIQRVEDNDFFHYEYYDQPNSGTHLKDIWRHRINLNIGLKSHYKHGSFLFSGKLVWNKNYNYGRFNLGDLDVDFESVEKNDVVNIQLQLSARYLF